MPLNALGAQVLGQYQRGAAVLEELRGALVTYVQLPTSEAVDAVVLWTAATHAQPAWEHATRLVIKSPQKRCGKTRLQEVISETCHAPVRTTNISPAALVRSIDESEPPTIILDEADTVFAKRRGERSEGAEDLRGILNSGHSRGWPYLRWDAKARALETCPTFCMAAIGGIGDMPDTIEDRAVVVTMQRRAVSERLAPFRRRHAVPALNDIRDRVNLWVRENMEALGAMQPEVPVDDRAADVWESLIAIADLAGGDWPERARRACLLLTSNADADDEGTRGERLLADMVDVFGDADRLTTAVVLARLHNIDEAPWGEWFTARHLARELRTYGIKSTNIRTSDGVAKGYNRHDFEDSWTRYTHPGVTAATPLQTPHIDRDFVSDGPVADSETPMRYTSATPRFEPENGPETALSSAVADVAGDRLEDDWKWDE